MIRKPKIIEAVKYAEEYKGKTFVIKVGGDLFKNIPKAVTFLEDIHHLRSVVGINIILVHGAGPQTNDEISERGLPIKKDAETGLRITDEETLECVLTAQDSVNKLIVNTFHSIGKEEGLRDCPAIGSFSMLEDIIKAEQVSNKKLGYVGKITDINKTFLKAVLSSGAIAVINSIGIGKDAEYYNINADHVAEAIAVQCRADHLIMVTDSGGLYKDFGTPGQKLISEIDIDGIDTMLVDTHDLDGMKPKLIGVLSALKGGVKEVQIVSAENILEEILTSDGAGTLLVNKLDRPKPLVKIPAGKENLLIR